MEKEAIYRALTDAQQEEALEACIAILQRWSELAPLTALLEDKKRELTSRYETSAREAQATA